MSAAGIEIDQLDLFGRLQAAPELNGIALLNQKKGVTENDILVALSVLNDGGTGKIGVCIIVLMPSLTPESGAGPRYKITLTVQVIEMPLINLGDQGTGISAERLAEIVRSLGHYFQNGFGGTYYFDGMEPITVVDGQISYGVKFSRIGGDSPAVKVTLPHLAADNGNVSPANVTLTNTTAGADIWYTTDDSYPSSKNPSAHLYSDPFLQSEPATIRVAAEKTGMQQSDVRKISIS